MTSSANFKLTFTKLHGLGNDFILVDDLGLHSAVAAVVQEPASDAASVQTSEFLTPELARKICDRRFGVGADQILWLRKPSEGNHARMEILNSDGSMAEMCGNGIRAVALYLKRHVLPKESEFRIDTLAGVKIIRLMPPPAEMFNRFGPHQAWVQVDMGIPTLGKQVLAGGEKIQLGSQDFQFYEINMGNPHAVVFVEDVSAIELEKWGPLLEKHSRFPKQTNVEFVQVKSPHSIQVRVWERGAGVTLACGTGACASAVASLATSRVQNPVEVLLPGGTLRITWAGAGFPVLMEGPAEEVFCGEYSLS